MFKTNEALLSKMRDLRQQTTSLNNSVVDDLKNFLDKGDGLSFRWLPTSESKTEISVATTCTALMTLSMNCMLEKLYGEEVSSKIEAVTKSLLNDKWDSTGLDSDNTFTTVLVLRTLATLLEHGGVSRESIKNLDKKDGDRFKGLNPYDICKKVGESDIREFGISKYPPHPAVGYWFVDAVTKLNVDLEPDKTWAKLAEWATMEFLRQISYITSKDHTMMDPISMAMAACILNRIKQESSKNEMIQKSTITKTPTYPELRSGILTFFAMQKESGIWDKYFPILYYPSKGANYCWCFEVLEAIFYEFPDIIDDELVINAIDKCLQWIVDHRLGYRKDGNIFSGWNSGDNLVTLKEGQPELWATGVVHMFLARIKPALSKNIQRYILAKYNSVPIEGKERDSTKWNNLLDSELMVRASKLSFKTIVESHFITPIIGGINSNGGLVLDKRSALLFGPPGTAKTSTVKAIAEAVNWPLIELSPSNFLTLGENNIYLRANEIFEELNELAYVVVLFDEIDALVQDRNATESKASGRLSLTEQFLTTSMLPKLAKLYDNGKILFFLATNHKKSFDDAIIRPGRFDMWLFVGPSSYDIKVTNLSRFTQLTKSEATTASKSIKQWLIGNTACMEIVEKCTYAEFRSLLKEICGAKNLVTILSEMGQEEFIAKIIEFGKYISLEEKEVKREYELDKVASRIF